MPEGPSLVILRELTHPFAGQRILKAEGDSKIDKARLVGRRIVALRTWGKHLASLDRQVTEAARTGAQVWVIFDNTAHGHALGNALALEQRGGGKRNK